VPYRLRTQVVAELKRIWKADLKRRIDAPGLFPTERARASSSAPARSAWHARGTSGATWKMTITREPRKEEAEAP
jgi:hypothetical protein